MAPEGTAVEWAHRPRIAPVTGGARPRWSVMIPTYNCAGYLRETLASVLAQDPGPERMQIEVVDDASTADDPEAVVRELAGGRVGFFRQPANVGHVRNFNSCLERSRGELVHLLHGDDYVRPGFYQAMERAFDERPDLGAAFCRVVLVDERGNWTYFYPVERDEPGVLENWLERLALEQRIQTPSMVVRRATYERLGGFDDRLVWAEDWEMWTRIATQFPVWYEPEPLAAYRMHSVSSTGRRMRTAENVRDLRRAIDLIAPLLPAERSAQLIASAREQAALRAVKSAGRLLMVRDRRGAAAQIAEGVRTSRSLRVIRAVAALGASSVGSRLRRIARAVLATPDWNAE